MLKYVMFSMVAMAACGADDDTVGPHSVGACDSDVMRAEPPGTGCEAACQHAPTYTGGSCKIAGSTTGRCDQTFTLDTGETGCCDYTLPDQVVKFFECQ